jgi:uncharacterized protein (DUF885 family)
MEFAPLAEHIVDAVLEANPVTAHYVGDHRFDHRLPDLSTDGVAADVAMLRDAAHALSQVDIDALDEAERVDHEILSSIVDRVVFERTDVREHEWNPLRHNPGPLLQALVDRPFAPVEERLEALADRLAAVPDALSTARTLLDDCPQIHLDTAVGQFQGVAEFLRDEVPSLVAQVPMLAGTVNPAADRAIAELEAFSGWLSRQRGARDPRLGRKLWEARLWHTLDTELTATQVLQRAEANLERVTSQIREAAQAIEGSGGSPAAALRLLSDSHPDDATIVPLAQRTMDETTAFVRDHQLVSLVDDPCVVREMPEFDRGVSVAYCDSPGPLETADVPTFYCIAPTPRDWTPELVESFYREYNDHMVRNLTVHEAMPGHFLQLAHARRYRGSTRVRALGSSGVFIEGWAVYAEQIMVEAGFGGPAVRMQQLKMQLRMTINALLDQLIHCEGLAEADAMDLMIERGFQERGEAAGKWRRALLTSTQLSTYFVGYTEVAAIGAARPAGTSPLEWHDAMLAQGSPSPRHLRTLLGLD